jgi:hypothetical protein
MSAAHATPAFAVRVMPDIAQAMAFFAALFGEGGPGLLHFRSVAEPRDGRPSQNHHYALDGGFEKTLSDWLTWCELDGRAAYVLPGTVDVGGTGKAGVLSVPCVVVDFDKGDTEANLAGAEALLGPATIVVESGGQTDAGTAKLHAYWRLATPAKGSAIEQSCVVRLALAERFGGDPAFKQQAQVIRVPGSVHMKGTPTLVKLRAVRPDARYGLLPMIDKLGCGSPAAGSEPQLSRAPGTGKSEPASDNFFDFNNVTTLHSQVDRVMTAPIRAEGQDDITRFEGAGIAIGHYLRQVREGRMTVEAAWEATRGWNQANMQPPWADDRLRQDFDRLIHIDVETHGPLVAPAPIAQIDAADEWSIEHWGLDHFARDIPARRWLVDGLIPLSTAGIFAAPGDAGKSMLALRLAYTVACCPAPTATMNSPAGIADTARFFGQPVTARGSVVMLTAEDDDDEVTRRLAAISSGATRNRVKGDGRKLLVVPMPSAGGVRAIMTSNAQGPQLTPFWHKLRAQLLAVPDLKLIILDPLSSFVAANLDNDNMAGAALMGLLGNLAAETGATIMMLHHFNKGGSTKITSLGDARSAIRGASSLVDNARWALAMWEADEEEAANTLKTLGRHSLRRQVGVVYVGGITKSNAPAEKSRRVMVRDTNTGILEDCTDVIRAARPDQAELDDAVHQAMREKCAVDPRFAFGLGRTSAWRSLEPLFIAKKLSVSKDHIEDILARLLADGRIQEVGKSGGYPVFGPSLD